MKTPVLALAAITLASGVCWAQEDNEEIDLEARKKSIGTLEQRIGEREARLTEIANDIIRLDKRLEEKVDKIVKRLAKIKDSNKSGFRVSQIKMEAMEGLARTVERYRYKRAEVIRDIREGRSGIPKDVLEGDAKHFDEHIQRRIEQIIEISKSFTQDVDIKKFEKVLGTSSSGYEWDDEVARISDEWRQNRRDRVMNKKQRAEVIVALKKAIERHQILIAGMRDSLENRKMSKTDRALMRAEMNRHIRIKDERQGQLEEIIIVDQPKANPLSRDAAHDLQESLRDAAQDMRRDMDNIFFKYTELNRGRAKVFELKKNLDARKKWISEHEAKESK